MTGPCSLPSRSLRLGRAAFVVLLVAATLVVAPVGTRPAAAQTSEWVEVWGIDSGIVANPKTWRFEQSTSAANDLGTANVAQPSFDDSGWTDVTLRWRTFPGPNVANHFRKEFDLADIGVTSVATQIEGVRMTVQYDDSAIVYLNGTEVYRSIRGNNDPTYTNYPLGTNLPYNAYIAYGGFENFYVHVPNWLGSNDCEYSGPTCPDSPYANNPPGNPGTDPPEIPSSLLVDGTNVWSITTWNQSGGGSGDSSLNHTFQVLKNDVVPPTVVINEVMADNETTYGVDLDGQPGLEYPDWFELHNTSNDPVDLTDWVVSDSTTSWVFPSVSIPANGYMVIVANDGDDGTTTPMQTNFKLSSLGDSLKLTDDGGVVADDYGAMPQQFADNSYGRANDGSQIAYLSTPTPGSTNSGAGNGYDPILRLFPDRLYNTGEPITHQVNAFDPDGDPLTYSLTPLPPGVTFNTTTGEVGGSAGTPGTYFTTLQVVDGDGDSAAQLVKWTFFAAPPTPPDGPPIVLNEYNAVASDRFLLSGQGVMGNGGDWFEFVVLEDELDLRGWTIEMYDMNGTDDQLRLLATATFDNRIELSEMPAGSVIVISQDNPDDLSFDGVADWTINLQMDNTANGVFFETETNPPPGSAIFNSNRHEQTVVIRDDSGIVVTPLSGESEAWDEANGGVSGGEVMNLCVNPSRTVALDPINDYKDNGETSTIGEPNQCSWPDPVNPGVPITFDQDFSTLRAGANLGDGGGDANCDGAITIADALLILQYDVGIATDIGACLPGGAGFGEMSALRGDVSGDGNTGLVDALWILQCDVGIPNPFCPA